MMDYKLAELPKQDHIHALRNTYAVHDSILDLIARESPRQIILNKAQTEQYRAAKRLIAPKDLKRDTLRKLGMEKSPGTPAFYITKYLLTGIYKTSLAGKKFRPMIETIGRNLKSFGYKKNLKKSQVSDYLKKIVDCKIISSEKSGLLKNRMFGEIGEALFWGVFAPHSSPVQVLEFNEENQSFRQKTGRTSGKKPDAIHRTLNNEMNYIHIDDVCNFASAYEEYEEVNSGFNPRKKPKERPRPKRHVLADKINSTDGNVVHDEIERVCLLNDVRCQETINELSARINHDDSIGCRASFLSFAIGRILDGQWHVSRKWRRLHNEAVIARRDDIWREVYPQLEDILKESITAMIDEDLGGVSIGDCFGYSQRDEILFHVTRQMMASAREKFIKIADSGVRLVVGETITRETLICKGELVSCFKDTVKIITN